MRLTVAVPAILLPLLAALSVACSPLAQQGCPPANTASSVQINVERPPDNALLGAAEVRLGEPAPVFVEYGNDQLGWLRSPTSPAASTHRVSLLRLRADSTYQVRAFALDQKSCPSRVASAELKTGPLPDQLRSFEVAWQGRPSFELTAMDWPSMGP